MRCVFKEWQVNRKTSFDIDNLIHDAHFSFSLSLSHFLLCVYFTSRVHCSIPLWIPYRKHALLLVPNLCEQIQFGVELRVQLKHEQKNQANEKRQSRR